MLRQRLLTVAVILPLLLACMFLLPNPAWALLTAVPTILGALEWSRLAGYRRPAQMLFVLAIAATCLLLVVAQGTVAFAGGTAKFAAAVYLLALLFWATVAPAWLYFQWRIANPAVMAVVGWMVLVPCWLAVATLQKLPWLLVLLLLVVWIADTAAYFAGHRFGRRKLAPQISPGKTWEGVIGAAAAVLVYTLIASFVLQPSAGVRERIGLMIFAALLTAFSIVGDLFESWMKRQAGAKDSGRLLPGHGGILDRIDSLTAAMPFAALYFLQAVWRT